MPWRPSPHWDWPRSAPTPVLSRRDRSPSLSRQATRRPQRISVSDPRPQPTCASPARWRRKSRLASAARRCRPRSHCCRREVERKVRRSTIERPRSESSANRRCDDTFLPGAMTSLPRRGVVRRCVHLRAGPPTASSARVRSRLVSASRNSDSAYARRQLAGRSRPSGGTTKTAFSNRIWNRKPPRCPRSPAVHHLVSGMCEPCLEAETSNRSRHLGAFHAFARSCFTRA
jgi:hypothetical protein